uniref:Partner and localizer of BRCA2 n=1 Tax=Sphenodon punctatus TaxID=8508 RepID=A0A8D0H181_SPHPU
MLEMADLAGKILSWQEKEKLKEKLALLKREYSKTLNKLQRAQRAERVKTYVKKTVAEQNQLLRQEEVEKDPTESMGRTSPGGEGNPEQPGTPCDVGTERRTSVTFNLEPVFFNNEANSLENPCAGSRNNSQGSAPSSCVVPTTEEKQNRLPRSRMKLRRRVTLVSVEKEPICGSPPISGSQRLENPVASPEEPTSPVFKGRSSNSDTSDTQRTPKPVIDSLTPQDLLLERDLQETSGGNVSPVMSKPPLRGLLDGDSVQQLASPCGVGISENFESGPSGLGNGIPVLLGDAEDRGRKLAGAESVHVDQEELAASEKPFPANGHDLSLSGNRIRNERTPKETQRSNPGHRDCPLDITAESPLACHGLQTETGPPVPEEMPPPAAAGSPLSSCTMVEGLLYPVEYYVRTTRRMSSCQRKVDLEAVIDNQLGRSRRGQRGRYKQITPNTFPVSQETAQRDMQPAATRVPSLGLDVELVGSTGSSPRSLSLSNESSVSSGSPSQTSVLSLKRGKGGARRRGRSQRGTAVSGLREAPESSDLGTPKGDGPVFSSDSQGGKRDCEGDPEEGQTGKKRVFPAATAGSIKAKGTDGERPAEVVLSPGGRCREPRLVQPQSLSPGSPCLSLAGDISPGFVVGLEASIVRVCQVGREPEIQLGDPKTSGTEQLLMAKVSLPEHGPPSFSLKHKAGQASKGGRGCTRRVGLGGPAPHGHVAATPAALEPPFYIQNEMLSLRWLPAKLDIKDFHLPEEEFGFLKSEKLQSWARQLETFVPAGAGDAGTQGDMRKEEQAKAKGQNLGSVFRSPPKPALPERLPPFESRPHMTEFSSSELLLTPAGTVSSSASSRLETQTAAPAFPTLGATPAGPPWVQSRALPDPLPASPLQTESSSFREPASPAVNGSARDHSAVTPGPLHRREGSAEEEKGQGNEGALRLEREGNGDPQPEEAETLEGRWLPRSGSAESSTASAKRNAAAAARPAVTLNGSLRDGALQLTSKLKNLSSSCAVDMGTVWWEAGGCVDLCIVTACETSVSLWKSLDSGQWGTVCTWHLAEIPVIQIIPLPDVRNLVCVALGDLEIGEIRGLFRSSEDGSVKQLLVKSGNIKAILGLTERRLVSSSGTPQDQDVEIVCFSEPGRNLKTGQLLKKMPVGYSYPLSICQQAYSDSGLLFVVLSHPHAKESESCGNPAFRVVAFNPKTARSTGVMIVSLPHGHTGRYLEGEVKASSAAAVLTSGAIAVWDLLLGVCTALLPPNADGDWSMVRWSVTDSYLLAGQKDGSVYVYRYKAAHNLTQDPCSAEFSLH